MIRFASFAATLAASTLFAASAASAGFYDAKPVAAPAKASSITGGVMWKCADGVCTAPSSSTRAPIVCELVAKRYGALTSFSADGKAFDEAALAKCNSRAK
ncbi:CC_3452 family protein [Sphingomonas sp. GB1N7]|uniref:CC_3452 family protein n=1 Tax=Parasphingomonas caseinilytica TaxID=3096158 RepID=UPI002FC8DAF3